MPPSGYANHPAALPNGNALSTIVANCRSCHDNISASATNVSNAFSNKAIHIDGNPNFVQNCDSCHSYNTTSGGTAWGKLTMYNPGDGGYAGLEGYGAHAKHIEYLKKRFPLYSSLKPTDTFSSLSFQTICGACHTTNATYHSMDKSVNRRQITFSGRVSTFGSTPFYNGSSHTSSGFKPKTCSNLDCHYKTSPIWSTY
jgi:hypothetical protein